MSSKAQRRGSDYRRKRKRFHNNQYTRKVSDKLDVDCISASAKKLCKESDRDKEVRNFNQSNGYRLINIDILLSELSQYVTCPNCNTKAVLKEKILYGLVSEFYVECHSCSTLSTFKSSPVIASGKDYEVNTRITYAMRTVGQGFCGIKHFCTAMDLPPPVSQKAYEKILRKINLASCEVADDSMKNAAKEEILASGSNEICVSGDENRCSDTTDIDELNSRDLRKRMKFRIKLLSNLRQRFRKEYIGELIQKQNDNWVREPRVGEMVLIGNDNKKRLSWPIAKIIELIPGRDVEIHTVRLKTQHGTVKHPVQCIFPLEVQANANNDKELKDESSSVKCTKPENVLNTDNVIVKKYTSSGRLVKEPKRLDLLNYKCYRFETLPSLKGGSIL
ncbi:DUF5641 domain-containing protein [Trichonephila clavata]|uniref:DUF5641 domain-containing protein n=1 Tax=Trichonephila clavata TaxID=2740835 RepID=A0A8X6K6C0_TRICU|nr:DUF5641 domain-containing protein [Trichonephila clavata]